MADERLLSINAPNVATILAMGAVGFALLIGALVLIARITGKGGPAGA